MSAIVSTAEWADPRSPSWDCDAAARAVASASRELRDAPEAVALARIACAARREVAALDRPAADSPYRAAFNICLDAFALARDELDNLIHLACAGRDLERSALPSTGELADRLAAGTADSTCSDVRIRTVERVSAQDRLVSSPIHCSERI